MNELKPEDVMKALDIIDKMDFFQGQRAGRELWLEKPFEVQEQDIADFSQGIEFVKNLVTNALALLRELTEQNLELGGVILKKDAEIERLKAEMKILRCEDCWNLAQTEALTEFKKRLVEKTQLIPTVFNAHFLRLVSQVISEMKGENNDTVSESKD